MRYLFLFLPLLAACSGAFSESGNPVSNDKIVPWAQDSTYFSWNGDQPVLLLGAGPIGHPRSDPQYAEKLKLLADAGGNYVSVLLDDQQISDVAYLDTLTVYLREAGRLGVAVDLVITDSSARQNSFRQFVDGFPNVLRASAVRYAKQAKGYPHWEETLARRIIATAQGVPLMFPNLTAYGEIAGEGIAGYNRSILAGAAAVQHASPPAGDGYSGATLANIRSIRTVEKYFNFWDLKPAMYILPDAVPNSAYAATDGRNGYLLYLPTAGAVDLRLNIRPEVPLRVTVIGYLGTQKSEVLRPPYGNSFTLFTEEPRGGWMVIKPL